MMFGPTNDRDPDEASEPSAKDRRRFLLRYYRVWNVEQCELPQAVLDKLPKIETHEHDPIEAAERIIAGMPNPPEIRVCGLKGLLQPDHGSHHPAPARAFHERRGILRHSASRDRSSTGPPDPP